MIHLTNMELFNLIPSPGVDTHHYHSMMVKLRGSSGNMVKNIFCLLPFLEIGFPSYLVLDDRN